MRHDSCPVLRNFVTIFKSFRFRLRYKLILQKFCKILQSRRDFPILMQFRVQLFELDQIYPGNQENYNMIS